MVEAGITTRVTRREFYLAMGLVWLYIAFAFGELMRDEMSWIRGLFWGVSFLMAILYLVSMFRSGAVRPDKSA